MFQETTFKGPLPGIRQLVGNIGKSTTMLVAHASRMSEVKLAVLSK